MPHIPVLLLGLLDSWGGMVAFGGGLFISIAGLAWMVVSSLCEEATAPLEKWRKQRPPLTNQKQKPAIRASIARLSSPRRYVRVEGLQLLAQFNDPSCVSALLRVLEMYPDDVPFLVDVVRLLEQLNDDCALPTLRKISVNRHHALKQAAHHAIKALDPRSMLLRAGSAPCSTDQTLLRAAVLTAPDALPHCSERARRPI